MSIAQHSRAAQIWLDTDSLVGWHGDRLVGWYEMAQRGWGLSLVVLATCMGR